MAETLNIKRLIISLAICLLVLILVAAVCAIIPLRIDSDTTLSLKRAISDHDSIDYRIIFQIRLSRILLAALVGAALACSGATLQAILRNPLADPYILGISSGAALGVIIAITFGISFTLWAGSTIALFAFCGALATVWLVWFVGHFAAGSSSVTSLLLAGVVINAFLSAVIMFLTSIARSDQVRFTALWLMGYLTDINPAVLTCLCILVILGIVVLCALGQKLNILSLGPDQAKALGINPQRVRLCAFALAALITALVVSQTGLIGFVGLIVPHAVRLVFGPDHRRLLPVSALTGAAFLVIADTLARSILQNAELPVGVITALVGGPFFLVLLARYSRKVSWMQ